MIDTNRSGPTTIWPWVAGRDLAGRLTRHGRPEKPWAQAIADEIDDTVKALHERGLVHGALGADHVLLDLEGRPLLIGLDPSTRARADTRARDLKAAATIRDLLVGDGAEVPTKERRSSPASDRPAPAPAPPGLVPAGRQPSSMRRARLPVAAGLAVTAIGAVVGMVRAGDDAACPVQGSADGPMADVDGDGCADQLRWSSETGQLVARTASGPMAWRLGQPGDRFILGDWNCDGALTPGLERPATGRTYGFDRWPGDRPVEATVIEGPPRCAPDNRP
jgi:hypothetical protein